MKILRVFICLSVIIVFLVSPTKGVLLAEDFPIENPEISYHTFLNLNITPVNDITIVYNKLPLPREDEAFPPEGVEEKSYQSDEEKKQTSRTFDKNIPPLEKVRVEIRSNEKDVKVEKYWWTYNGSRIGPEIPVYYPPPVTANPLGDVKITMVVHKPPDSVLARIVYAGTENVDISPGAITLSPHYA